MSNQPAEYRLADWLTDTKAWRPARSVAIGALRRLGAMDQRAYDAVAGWSSPALDAPLREVSRFADFSKPWLLTAGILAVAGGPTGRRAALTGVAAIAATSLMVNQPMKLASNRARPDREESGVPRGRWIRMPDSTSFPSGHSASAAAFAVAVGDISPGLRLPVGASAAAVAFSRVYTGVHYPGDVLVGASVGAVVGRLSSKTVLRWAAR